MTALQVAAQQLAGTALAPGGSQLVLAEWTAQGSTADEPLYQAPLHHHPEDEAWYVLRGTLAIRAGEHIHQISAGGAVIVPAAPRTPSGTRAPIQPATCSSWEPAPSRSSRPSTPPMTEAPPACDSYMPPTAPRSSTESRIIPPTRKHARKALLPN